MSTPIREAEGCACPRAVATTRDLRAMHWMQTVSNRVRSNRVRSPCRLESLATDRPRFCQCYSRVGGATALSVLRELEFLFEFAASFGTLALLTPVALPPQPLQHVVEPVGRSLMVEE